MLNRVAKTIFNVAVLLSLCIIAIWLLVARPTFVTSEASTNGPYIKLGDLKQHVIVLSDKYVPRNSDHPDNLLRVAKYIENQFRGATQDIEFQDYTAHENRYRNVIASFGPESDEAIIVGAHYDAFREYAGADDNASGVAGLIELAKLLKTTELSQRVLLVAYTLEEPPYFASTHMGSAVHAQSVAHKNIRIMISLEMIGYFDKEPNSQSFPVPLMSLMYPSSGNYIAIVDELWSNNAAPLKAAINKYTNLPAYSINAPSDIVGIDFSDHRSYWSQGHPAVMVTDTSFYRNHAYHTEGDTHEKLDYESMAKVVFGVFKYIQEINK